MSANLCRLASWVVLFAAFAAPAAGGEESELWALAAVARPEVPASPTGSSNPIDAFVAAGYRLNGVRPVGQADRRTLLRRVYLDLVGLPPTPAEQQAFADDPSPGAYGRVVDRLLDSPQHGVRYGRHWLDVLRYADADERMVAARGIYLWRDWVINALNADLPYDQFVRAQLTGYRTATRTSMSDTGVRSRREPRPDDVFALGLLARGGLAVDNKRPVELAIAAVETVSTAFMGMTVGCAKCHDHMYDPISQRDFYAMKALFDPLVLRKITLATPAEIVAEGKAIDDAERKREELEAPVNALIAPYKKALYDARVAMLPVDVRAVILKPEKARTAEEQKTADDYFPVLRIDPGKIMGVMPEAERKTYQELLGRLNRAGLGRRRSTLPEFWTVEVDPKKATEASYVLTSGDPDRPEKGREVSPGWPFAPDQVDFREGRVEAFSDWLTAADNPLFARVAVNRLWQWHFGEGLVKTPSDFGTLGGPPTNPPLLDWLASEFVRRGFRMKAIHRLIVTSEAYTRASEAGPDPVAPDPGNDSLRHFRLRRLEAEPIWDSILSAAGALDLTVGGPSFDPRPPDVRGAGGRRSDPQADARAGRRAAYMIRGYASSREVVPDFLQSFDVDDGRAPCPVRTRTVTAPQALLMMNGEAVERAAEGFAGRLRKESGGDLGAAVELAYTIALARPPSPTERGLALSYLGNDPVRLKGLAWLLFNLDEFLFVR